MVMAYSFHLCTLLKKNDMLDIHNLMEYLSQHRPLFHSEADFQRQKRACEVVSQALLHLYETIFNKLTNYSIISMITSQDLKAKERSIVCAARFWRTYGRKLIVLQDYSRSTYRLAAAKP